MTFEDNGASYVLLQAAPRMTNRSVSFGAELAEFHQKGRGYPYEVKETSRIGQWKDLWGKRLDQLEQFWIQKRRQDSCSLLKNILSNRFLIISV